MKLVHEEMDCVLDFGSGHAIELVIEHKKFFLQAVQQLFLQAGGEAGKWVLSLLDKPVEFSRYADVTVQFAPFEVNRKGLLAKLYAALEKRALGAEHYEKTYTLLGELERFVQLLAEELPFEIDCQKVAIGPILRAIAPEVAESATGELEKIFSYMEMVRELDRDKLFVMVNMRAYFSDAEMEAFLQSVCLHDFKVLLLESVSFPPLKHTKRHTIDADLCEF